MFSRCAHVCRPVLIAWMVCAAPSALAQAPDPSLPALDVFKRVASDPTTYAPAIVVGVGLHLDWKSSQVFFRHGFVEQNPAFTVSGRANDTPISHGAGNRKIREAVFVNLGTSLLNNVTVALVERALIDRHPTHRKLVRGLGWTERIAFASWVSYRQSAAHFRQWQRNNELARQLAY